MAANKWQRGLIYIIRNTQNDIPYIGHTTQHEALRFRWHLHHAGDLKQSSPFYTAMRTIGPDKFGIYVLHRFPCNSKKELEDEEDRVIEQYRAAGPVYNEKLKGGRHSKTTRAKMAARKVGNKNALKFGTMYFVKGKGRLSYWAFSHRVNNANVVVQHPVHRLGYWEAKRRAEVDRLQAFPAWVKPAEEAACEELLKMEF
jgi:hypothetical protein